MEELSGRKIELVTVKGLSKYIGPKILATTEYAFSNTDLLKHILDEAEFINSNLEGLTVDKLEVNPILQRAFIRSIEVIGEAAKNVQTEFRSLYPEVEWRNMARMRDRLIHHYFDVDFQVLYQTCVSDIPELIFNIKTILSVEENKEGNTNSN